MSRYILGKDAGLDIESVWDYIAQDSAEAADKWIDKLFEAFDAIARSPGIGHRRPDLTDLYVLFWPVGRYIVIYRRRRTVVEIVAVTQGSRDVPKFLHTRFR